MHTLKLIIGAMAKKARQFSEQEITVDHFMYTVSLYLSIAYLVMVLITWFMSNFTAHPVD